MKENSSYINSLADNLINSGKIHEAIVVLEKFIKDTESHDPDIFLKLSNCCREVGEVEEAKKYADLAGIHGNWDVQAAVSFAFQTLDDYAKSIYWLIKSAENGDPDSPYTLLIKYGITFPIKPYLTPEFIRLFGER